MQTPQGLGKGGPSGLAIGSDKSVWIWDSAQKKILGYQKKQNAWKKLDAEFVVQQNKQKCNIHGGTGMVCA